MSIPNLHKTTTPNILAGHPRPTPTPFSQSLCPTASAGRHQTPEQNVGFLSLALSSQALDDFLSHLIRQADHELGLTRGDRICVPDVEVGVEPRE